MSETDDERRELHTLGVHPESVIAYYRLESGDTAHPGDGLRFSPSFEGGEGFRELVEICPGFEILIGDLRYGSPVTFNLREDASLKFHFRLSGASDISIDGDNATSRPPRSPCRPV